ncbi:Melatonin-Related Receptor [Manis pentadactyla]|nr:Melatonin-Related Receptor [Manis pentadactyla]
MQEAGGRNTSGKKPSARGSNPAEQRAGARDWRRLRTRRDRACEPQESLLRLRFLLLPGRWGKQTLSGGPALLGLPAGVARQSSAPQRVESLEHSAGVWGGIQELNSELDYK